MSEQPLQKLSQQNALLAPILESISATKGERILVLDLSEASSYTEFLVLASGTSDRQLQAMAERIYLKLKQEQKLLPVSYEGEGSEWMLLDYGSVIVHLMSETARDYYDLEGLWKKVPRFEITDASFPAP